MKMSNPLSIALSPKYSTLCLLLVSCAKVYSGGIECLAQARYEVVSVHPANPEARSSGFSDEGAHGGIKATNVTVLQTLLFAYGIEEFEVLGVPQWARSLRFDIMFTPAEEEPKHEEAGNTESRARWTRQQQRMQAVLRDRFNLIVHNETRTLPIYILKAPKGDYKSHAAAHPERQQTIDVNKIAGGYRLIAASASMGALADTLTWKLERSVRDETEVSGLYDFRMDWGVDAVLADTISTTTLPGDVPQLPSIFTAIKEQLGLRLESAKGPVPVLVIDRVDQPSSN